MHLAIPVFVRTSDGSGKDSLEFATAINISPGGALVVVRRSLPKSALVSLEIPSAPIGPVKGLKTSLRIMQAKAVWVKHLDDYHLLGLKFARPLEHRRGGCFREALEKSRFCRVNFFSYPDSLSEWHFSAMPDLPVSAISSL